MMARLSRLATLPLLIAVLAFGLLLSQRYDVSWDLTDAGRNSLTPAQQALLEALDDPVSITAFTRDLPVQRHRASKLIERLKGAKSDIEVQYVDPIVHPEKARAAGIEAPGQWLIRYRDRAESRVAPALPQIVAALERLARTGAQWIVELEQSDGVLLGAGGVTAFGQALEQRGYRVVPLSLLQSGNAPDNTALLVLAGATTKLGKLESNRLIGYLKQGGNLLWLSEDLLPDQLAEYLGVTVLPGTIVDAAAADLKLERPDFAVTLPSPGHPLGGGFDRPVVMPQARALQTRPGSTWRRVGGLQTGAQSWNEIGELSGSISREPLRGELSGPLLPALLLNRPGPNGGAQRVAVIGDIDLLSDAHLGREANLAFGLALVRWLTENEHLGAAATAANPGTDFHWSHETGLSVSLGVLGGLPLLALAIGVGIRLRRRHR